MYTFVTYNVAGKEVEMLLIQDFHHIYKALTDVVGVSLIKSALSSHALGLPGKPTDTQILFNPITIGNMVYDNLRKIINVRGGGAAIMNSKGGYQKYDEEKLKSMGWKEISREEKKKLIFKKQDNEYSY